VAVTKAMLNFPRGRGMVARYTRRMGMADEGTGGALNGGASSGLVTSSTDKWENTSVLPERFSQTSGIVPGQSVVPSELRSTSYPGPQTGA